MYIYCDNDPVNAVDPSGMAGELIKLGGGWWARLDVNSDLVGNDPHWHVWKGKLWSNASEKYALSVKGKISHPKDWPPSSYGPPNSVKKNLKSKTGFDWDATRKSFENNVSNIVNRESYGTYTKTNYQGIPLEFNIPLEVIKYSDGSVRAFETLYLPGYKGKYKLPSFGTDYVGANLPFISMPLPTSAPFFQFAKLPSFSFRLVPVHVPILVG